MNLRFFRVRSELRVTSISVVLLGCLTFAAAVGAEPPRVLPDGVIPDDIRLGELRNLNGYFPFQQVDGIENWPSRRDEIRRRILISQGLWPMPPKAELDAVIHGRVERDDYKVDRVFFESIPGHYVTGSLYRPKEHSGPLPAILSPHGHWKEGRFYQASDSQVREDLASGAERFEAAARFPIQARAVQLARMGCLVFVYDMTGNADSIQIGHRPDDASHLDREQRWGFFSAQAELRLQNMMGLQTWNSIRAIDFLLGLDETDASRIGVTGASGGGTQSMIIGAIDDRITAAMPCVMVSTAMQGGCTCENAPYMRIGQGNIDIAAAIAPRPLGLTAADDWTIELETKGYPGLRQLFMDLGKPDNITAAFHTQFKHNYNHVNRAVTYGFFNRHFRLGADSPVLERDFEPLSREEATVWSGDHSAPTGEAIGDSHEVRILELATRASDATIGQLVPQDMSGIRRFDEVIGKAWGTILGRHLRDVNTVTFKSIRKLDDSGLEITCGTLEHSGEQLPSVLIQRTSSPSKGTVVWVTDVGKSALWSDGACKSLVSDITASGYSILSADLIGQGEFTGDSDSVERQRMWYQRGGDRGWHRFSGYTFGYNDPLFVQRTHDVLTMIRFAEEQGGPVHLIGIGEQAGPIAAAARSQAADAVSETYLDLSGFRFDELTEQDDPMFVPGAVKYLGVDALLSLTLPGSIDLAGGGGAVLREVVEAKAATDALRFHADRERLYRAIRESLMR